MRLGHIELFCKDTFATQSFYSELLGFEITEVQGANFVWLRSEDSELLLRPGKPPKNQAPTYQTTCQAIVIYCDDIISLQNHLETKGIKLAAPDGDPDNITFQDPDGRWLQAVERN